MSDESPLSGNLLLVAFDGWTDAGAASTDALAHVESLGTYVTEHTADPEEYLDYQFTRPRVELGDGGRRRIVYPSITLARDTTARADARIHRLHLLSGAEPARRWRRLTDELLPVISGLDVSGIVFLGALLADAPHTRPIAVHASSSNDELCRQLDIAQARYEGPVGYLNALGLATDELGIPSVSIWASVPHYAHGSPSPKATTALIKKIEQLTGARIPHGELDAQAGIWESTLNDLARDDADLQGYIEQLEETRDNEDPPSASGDSIAAEIEKYLRRKDDRRGGSPS